MAMTLHHQSSPSRCGSSPLNSFGYQRSMNTLFFESWGDSHVKVTGMFVVSLRDVNCRFRSHLGCLGRKVSIFVHSGIA